jgi:di/tricarboxylate transporter
MVAISTAIVTNLISNNAAAALMFPIAVEAAREKSLKR